MTNLVTAESGERFTLFFSIRSPFSNFYPCRLVITDQGNDNASTNSQCFNCTEQYYMYHKALSSGDLETANDIMKEREARKIKMLGKNVRNFDQLKWDTICEQVMWRGNIAKYTQNDELRKKLFYTHGSILVECSPNDTIWGIGLDIHEPDALNPTKWRGQNKLGHMLTRIREHLWEQPEYAKEVEEATGMLNNFDKFASQYFQPPKPRPIARTSFTSAITTSNTNRPTNDQQIQTRQMNWRLGTPTIANAASAKRSRSPDWDRAAFSPPTKVSRNDDSGRGHANGNVPVQSEKDATAECVNRTGGSVRSSSREKVLTESGAPRSTLRGEKSMRTKRRTRDSSDRSRHERHRWRRHKRSSSSSSSRSGSSLRGKRYRRKSPAGARNKKYDVPHRRHLSRYNSESDSSSSSEVDRHRRHHRKKDWTSSDSSVDCTVKKITRKRSGPSNTDSEASTSESLGSRNSAKWDHGANVFKSLLQKLRQKPSGLWEKVDGGNLCFEQPVTNGGQLLRL
uniref:NADAR domain-containing protein n=3 Tax=Parascaris TaxID=6254 RepID=A0A915B460_PARUN